VRGHGARGPFGGLCGRWRPGALGDSMGYVVGSIPTRPNPLSVQGCPCPWLRVDSRGRPPRVHRPGQTVRPRPPTRAASRESHPEARSTPTSDEFHGDPGTWVCWYGQPGGRPAFVGEAFHQGHGGRPGQGMEIELVVSQSRSIEDGRCPTARCASLTFGGNAATKDVGMRNTSMSANAACQASRASTCRRA